MVINGFAVLGGAAVGGFACGLLLQLLARFVSRWPVPRPILNFVRLLGAIASGWLIALLLFQGGGGWGFGGGGGWGFGGAGTSTGKTTALASTESASQKEKKEDETSASAGSLRVEIIGDPRAQESRFYRLEAEPALYNLVELRKVLMDRKRQGTKVQGIVLLIYENSPATDHPAVTELIRWVKEQELRVGLEYPKGNAP